MKQSQKEIILEILEDGERHSNFEIHAKTSILRYSARILDLKRDGYEIHGFDDDTDPQKYWYQLIQRNINGVIIQKNDQRTTEETQIPR